MQYQQVTNNLSFDYVQTLDESSIHTFIALKNQELSILNDRLKVIKDAKTAKANAEYLKKREIEIAKEQAKLQAALFAEIEKEKLINIPQEDIEDSTSSQVLRAWTIAKDDWGNNIDPSDEDFQKITHISHVECESEPKFGDILDFTGYRHYSWMFVGKNGKLFHASGNYDCHCYSDNIEYGVVVPVEISRYLEDPWKKYSSNVCVQAYELTYNSKIVQSYKNVPKDCLYTYLLNEYEQWELYAYKPGQEILLEK